MRIFRFTMNILFIIAGAMFFIPPFDFPINHPVMCSAFFGIFIITGAVDNIMCLLKEMYD